MCKTYQNLGFVCKNDEQILGPSEYCAPLDDPLKMLAPPLT